MCQVALGPPADTCLSVGLCLLYLSVSVGLCLQQIRSLAPLTSLSSDAAATPPLCELYCAANKVTAIEGLSALTALTLLELGSNRVRNIEGLEVRVYGGGGGQQGCVPPPPAGSAAAAAQLNVEQHQLLMGGVCLQRLLFQWCRWLRGMPGQQGWHTLGLLHFAAAACREPCVVVQH